VKPCNRIVEIWVPNGTPEAQIEQIRIRYENSGCLVVIYRSGSNCLVELTKHLLSINA